VYSLVNYRRSLGPFFRAMPVPYFSVAEISSEYFLTPEIAFFVFFFLDALKLG